MEIPPGDVSPADLRRQLDRLQVMYDLASAVGRAAPPEELFERALDGLQRAVGADRASVLSFDDDGVMRFRAWRGLSERYRATVEGHSPWKREARDPEPLLVPDVEADGTWASYLPVFRAEGIRALAFVPLTYGGRLLGKFMLYYLAPHAFGTEEISLARTIAAHIAFALERARAEQVQRFLFEAGDALADSMDYDATRRTAARLAVPFVADWCAVEMLGPDGELEPLVFAHRDPTLEALALETRRAYPPRPGGEIVFPVLREGEPICVGAAGERAARKLAYDDRHAEALLRVGLESYMVVPLCVRAQVLGVMSFGSARATRRFGLEDLSLAEALAQRAAVAIEKARLYREACEASRIKDEFLATVSHELRTPLNAILGWARMLSQGQLEPTRRTRAIEAINRNADAQARLIEDILDVSRIVTGKVRIDAGPVDLGAVVSAAVECMRPAAEARGLRLELRAGVTDERGRGETVLGDADRLQQVVWNLVSNAIKFTPQGGSVEVSIERVGAEVWVRVADTGAGIPPEFLPYVFDRFRQADSSTRRAHGGLGLGLAIVRHLAELHGGSVRAESAGLGRGATFTVVLPAARASQIREQPEAEIATAPERAGVAAVSVAGLRVLVVDDEADARELANVALTAGGAQVRTAGSVEDAMALLVEQPPDVLVSDIAMPGEDGYDLIRRANEIVTRRGPRLRAVALTAYARDEDVRRAVEAGFDVHLAKPVDPAELLRVVARAAGR